VGLVVFIALIGYAGVALTRTARDLRQQRRDADADLVINFAVGAMAYLVALLFLTFTDRLFWMLVALALTVPQIAGLSMRMRAGSLAGVASGASARVPGTGAATGIAAAPLVGTGREASAREEVHAPAPAKPAAARHPGDDREARRPTVFVTGSRCSGVPEARNLIRARDETMTSILMLAPETTTGAELLALCRGTRLIWVYRNFRAATATSARQLTASHNELRLERLLRQIHADRQRSWQRRQIECIRTRAKGKLSSYDVAALAWYLKNSELFRLGLDCDARVLMLNDAVLGLETGTEISRLRVFVGLEPTVPIMPGRRGGSSVTSPFEVGLDAVPLSGEVSELCEDLWRALERLRDRQRRDLGAAVP
jgi:hypothetical protein